ncbi:MAG: hypothetical protein CMI63_12230 [Parvularcula sp.]|uniref:hypothetical protein n=1 Tax=Hyphococcus sp. TaxID=2038636 RepID=UPI000C4DD647|nr:hypothetical protein [Parvularcula sp.]MCK5749144.1 hypothetical protein [Oricola sp.]
MEMIIDFMLLAASGAATFYCFILSRKLEALKSTEKGLGATIATMSHTVDQARATVTLAKESSAESINELTPLIEETKDILPQLTEMIDVISELAEIAIRDVNEASGKAGAELDERLSKAKALQERLDEQIDFFLVDNPDPDGPGSRMTPKDDIDDENISYLDDDEDDEPAARTAKAKAKPATKVTAALMKARNQRKMKKLAG